MVAGLIGGVMAAGVMSVVHSAVTAPRKGDSAEPPREQGDDATVKVASAITRAVAGRDVPPDKKKMAGSIVHYAFGAMVGAGYGAVAEALPRVAIGAGVPFGAAVWLGAHIVTVPALGLAPPATRRPWSAEALELGLHLLYGLSTDVVRRFVRARL